MRTRRSHERAHREILLAADSRAEPRKARECIARTLEATLGFDQWSWAAADLASGLGVSWVGGHAYCSALPRLLRLQQRGPQLTFEQILKPTGFLDEIRHEIRDVRGCWGTLDLARADGKLTFSDRDRDFMRRIGPALARVSRRSITGAPFERWSDAGTGPGTLLIDRDFTVRASTSRARAWLTQIAPPHRRCEPISDRQPEHHPIAPRGDPRPSWRPQRIAARQLLHPSSRPAHRDPLSSSVATTS